jgi:hypothetical protein
MTAPTGGVTGVTFAATAMTLRKTGASCARTFATEITEQLAANSAIFAVTGVISGVIAAICVTIVRTSGRIGEICELTGGNSLKLVPAMPA